MDKLEAKYRLHATKVDRIAVVDRPAVPDAKVVLFKRKDTEDVRSEKATDFNREFVYKSTLAAVDVLEQGFWNSYYFQEEGVENAKEWNTLFKDFRSIIIDVVAKITPNEKIEKADAQDEPTVEEVVGYFDRYLNVTMLSQAFEYFKNYMGYLMLSVGQSPNSVKIITKVIDIFEGHVMLHGENALATYDKSRRVVIDKEGRVLSGARMRKLEEAMAVIAEILEDAKPRVQEKLKEEAVMEIQEMLKALEESPILKGLVERLTVVETTLKEAKLLLTPEEKADLEKKEADAKAEIEKKEAEAKAELEKAEAEKAEADKVEAEKKAAEDAVLEKKRTDDAEARLVAMEKGIEGVTKVAESIAKKMGLQTSLKSDGSADDSGPNAFDKALQKR